MNGSEYKSNKVISSISWSVAEKFLTDAIGSIISIILARLLFPEDYGLISLIQVFINLSLVFVNNGLGSSLIQKKDCNDEQISTVFYLNIILGIIMYIILYTFAPIIANVYNFKDLVLLLRVLSLKVPISSIYNMQHSYIKKKLEFKKYFFSSLVGTLAGGLVGVILAYKGYGPWALVWFNLVDIVMDSAFLFITTKWIPRLNISIAKSKSMIKFGTTIFLSELVSSFYSQIRSLLIGLKYNTSDLAYNAKGEKFPTSINTLTTTTVMRVMYPVFSKIQDNREETIELARKSIKMSTFILTPLMIGIFCTADKFVPLLYSEKWNLCIPYIRVYCISFLFLPLSSLDVRVVEANGDGSLSLKTTINKILIGLLFIILSVVLFDNPYYIAVAATISNLFGIYLDSKACEKVIGYGPISHIKDALPSITIGLIMGIVVFLINLFGFNNLICFLLQILIGAIVYVVLSLKFKIESAQILLVYLKNTIGKQK